MIRCYNYSDMQSNSTFPFPPRYPNARISIPANNATINDTVRKLIVNKNIMIEVAKYYGYTRIFFITDIYKRKSIFFKLKYFYYCYKNHYKTPLYKAVISLIRTMVLGTR